MMGDVAALQQRRETPAYAMGGLLAMGGVAGFAASRSRPSLIAGLALGTGFAACGHAISAWPSPLSSGAAALAAGRQGSLTVSATQHRNIVCVCVCVCVCAAGRHAGSASPDTARRGLAAAAGLSALTTVFMGKRALWSRKLVRSLRTLPGGGIDAVYTNHRQYRLSDYARPGGIRWMPGGVLCAASSASLGYHYAELGSAESLQ
jgi:uncharacterized membrane protein (UPF0136 family)